MLTVYLFKVCQKGMDRYVGKAPGRLLAKLCEQPEMDAPQEAQRPLKEKRLRDLAKFAENEGILATSVVLGTTYRGAVTVKPLENADKSAEGKIYFMELPETDDEIAQLPKKIFSIIDGQHRLFSFLDAYCLLSRTTDFDLSFEMYITPTLDEQRLIFKNTNEYQERVPASLLLYFRSKLGMLKDEEKKYYPIVEMLTTQARSPLYGRIILSAEKISRGLQSQQIVNMFSKINLKDVFAGATDETIFNSLVTYLAAWEQEVGTNFSDCNAQYGPFYKISGLRYIINLLPTFVEISREQHQRFTEDFVKAQIRKIYNNDHMSITAQEFFDQKSSYNKENDVNVNMFANESNTIKLAQLHRSYLKEANVNNGSFNPFE